jgi:tetratricopeptide (TPR) repeat protein
LNDLSSFDRFVPDAENPWPGLHEFDEDGKDFFNGREQETADLLRLADDAPLTVLFGASGLGKTSLLLAGLTPRLRAQNRLPVYIRVDPKSRGAPLIEQATEALRAELREQRVDHAPLADGETLWEYLHRPDLELWSRTNHLVTPVLIFDQFEELFTLGDDNKSAVERFREDLGDLVENRVPAAVSKRFEDPAGEGPQLELTARRAKFVVSFREDFLPHVEGWRKDIPSLLRNRFRLLPMTGRQALEAVAKTGGRLVKPGAAERVVLFAAAAELGLGGKGSEAVPAVGVPDGGAPTDLAQITIEPALLSLVCTGLNDRRKAEKKDEIDEQLLTATGPAIVRDFYERCVRDLPERGRNFIEEELITESGYRNPFPRDDAIAQGYLTEDQLERLVRRRLLRVERQLGADRIELIHDLLTKVVRAFRDQERARKRDAEKEQTVRRLAAERDESRRVAGQRLRLLAAAVAALILAVVLAGFSFFEWRQANENLENFKTEQKRREAEAEKRQEAEAATKQAEAARKLAEATNERYQDQKRAIEKAVKQRADALVAASSKKDYKVAIDGLTSSLSIFERYADWSGIVQTKVARGKIYALLDRLAAAGKDLDEALETAKQNGSVADRALALESEASLHEQEGSADTESLYQKAQDDYRFVGDSVSDARIWEWKATRAEKDKQFEAAVDEYQHARERYRIAGDTIGAERIDEAIRRTVPWGFLADLKHGKVFPMRGDRVHIGRNTPEGAENDISFAATNFVSRRHLIVSRTSEGIQADDERSLNGTTVDAAQLPYGEDVKLADGDLISLANTEVLQFTAQEQPAPQPPPNAWAIFINGSTRTYTYLTEQSYSVVLTSNELRLEPGENPSAIVRVRNQQQPELFSAGGEWSLVVEKKTSDYDYSRSAVAPGKWTPIQNLPTSLAKLSADRKQILEGGPAFQIVTFAPK